MSLDPRPDGHAVVIGASVAGLTAAQALLPHMRHVTVVERDRLPRGPRRRRGTFAARHTHGLTAAGAKALEQLFPGITRELLGAGLVRVRVPEDVLLLGPGGWLPRVDSDLVTMTGSGILVEAVIRDRVRADPRVTVLQEHEAVGLRGGRNDTAIGVMVSPRRRHALGGPGETRVLPAEFIVDASGRESAASRWLAELGYDLPEESVADVRAVLSSAVFAPPVGHIADWKAIALTASADNPRHGLISPMEGGKWKVSIGERGAAEPCVDHEGLLRAAGRLRHPVLRDVIEHATPLGPVYGLRHTENRWRHYERLRRWPDQFVVVGDALATFGPSSGQGLAVAVESALTLGAMVGSHGTTVGLSYRLRRALALQVAETWRIAHAAGLTWPQAQATPPSNPATRLGRRYLERIAAAAPAHRAAARFVVELGQQLVTPAAALRPTALAAALIGPRGPVPYEPPSSTHGGSARRPRVRVPAGTSGFRPAAGRGASPAEPVPHPSATTVKADQGAPIERHRPTARNPEERI
ncbi:hypothetical protein FE633_23540 [Streptomyces montanus]|uniref:FAD-binding domain-containing protein n=1 Tax=Streptomyces montanus TaxID=2580423 RepID=A0A5R9FWA6_9ACTN|nr:hypothetical protein [Streptomyces montanus]TLS43775.1 hypothetical protein FE633_23540 [Streptomyces montanus]